MWKKTAKGTSTQPHIYKLVSSALVCRSKCSKSSQSCPLLAKRVQHLRARFSRGKVAPLAPTESRQEDAAAAPPALVVAGHLSGKKAGRAHWAISPQAIPTEPGSLPENGDEFVSSDADDFYTQFQPPLSPDLRSSIVTWAVRLIVSGSLGPNQPHHLELQERAEKGLREMLEQLLREDQSAGHVVGLLEASQCPLGARASPTYAFVFLPLPTLWTGGTRRQKANWSELLFSPWISEPFLLSLSFKIQDSAALGNLLVQLAVSMVDPNTGIRAQVFLGHLTQKQKDTFAQAAWGNVSHLAQDWVREGSLILLYSILGRARQLLEEEEEEL
uniref:Uncharacterized protein n=1 Tax=Sphaerodactylus townsendi TaxID=933632 RepID=A0ACB8FUD4_9SAUR